MGYAEVIPVNPTALLTSVLPTIRTPVRAGWKPTPGHWSRPPHGIRSVKSNTPPVHPSFDCDRSGTKMVQ
jgi:hypothetical protein